MSSPWRRPAARRVRAVRERLREMYGILVMEPHGDPVGELVLTVLSQSTNDRNRDVAFLRLRDRFPAWEAVRDAPGGRLYRVGTMRARFSGKLSRAQETQHDR